ATVTQVTVSQGAPGAPAQAGQQPVADAARVQSAGQAPAIPEVDELSRIEAGFNIDPMRVQQVGGLQQVQSLTQQLQPSQLPQVGDLRIWGLTFSQADRLIRDELARYFRGFQTSVTMGRLRTVSVHVVGEVCQPGVYTLSSLATVTNALYSAGGPSKLGSLRDVRL